MDGLVNNRYVPSAPEELRYEYEKIFDSLTRTYVDDVRGRDDIRTLTIGGGGLIYPSYLTRRYPRSRNDVVEIDPEVIRVARTYFGASPDPRLTVYNTDGRNFVHYAKGRLAYDLIYLDAFNSCSIPAHLTTREFARELRSILAPDGFVAANCIDIYTVGRFLNAYVNTLRAVFPAVSVFADTSGKMNERMTFVVVAGLRELGPHGEENSRDLYDAGGGRIGFRLTKAELDTLRGRDGEAILSDDHASVENLMAPVFLRSVK